MEKYDKFFKDMKVLKDKQIKQKMRGLNDYNMVNVVRHENKEVGMHSNVIYSLIDPHGLHYQGDLFLQLFIEYVIETQLKEKVNEYDGFGNIFDVQVEESTDENRRIDFTIKSDKYYIGIEMKINAKDLENQISHYADYLKKISADTDISEDRVFIYYLTKDGKDASLHSKGNTEIIRVSFEKHILNWLEACQEEVKNITNLNESFENYKNIVQKIIGKPKENIMSLSTKILDSEINFEIATEIFHEYHLIQQKIFDRIGSMIEKNIALGRVKYIKSEFNDKKIDQKPIVYFSIDDKYDIRIYCKDFYNFDIFRLGCEHLDDDQQNRVKEVLKKDEAKNFTNKYAGLWTYELKPKEVIDNTKLYKLYSETDEITEYLDFDEIVDLINIVTNAIDDTVNKNL